MIERVPLLTRKRESSRKNLRLRSLTLKQGGPLRPDQKRGPTLGGEELNAEGYDDGSKLIKKVTSFSLSAYLGGRRGRSKGFVLKGWERGGSTKLKERWGRFPTALLAPCLSPGPGLAAGVWRRRTENGLVLFGVFLLWH